VSHYSNWDLRINVDEIEDQVQGCGCIQILGLSEVSEQLREVLGRDWAVRVLDAAQLVEDNPRMVQSAELAMRSDAPSDHRMRTAQAIWPDLPESVRVELGVWP
jgi:hypothetical protein